MWLATFSQLDSPNVETTEHQIRVNRKSCSMLFYSLVAWDSENCKHLLSLRWSKLRHLKAHAVNGVVLNMQMCVRLKGCKFLQIPRNKTMTTSVSRNQDPDSSLRRCVNINCKTCWEWEHNLQKHYTNLLIMHGVQGYSSKACGELKYIQLLNTSCHSFICSPNKMDINEQADLEDSSIAYWKPERLVR